MLISSLDDTNIFQKFLTFLISQFDITTFHLKHKGWIMSLVWQIPSIWAVLHSTETQLVERCKLADTCLGRFRLFQMKFHPGYVAHLIFCIISTGHIFAI